MGWKGKIARLSSKLQTESTNLWTEQTVSAKQKASNKHLKWKWKKITTFKFLTWLSWSEENNSSLLSGPVDGTFCVNKQYPNVATKKKNKK